MTVTNAQIATQRAALAAKQVVSAQAYADMDAEQHKLNILLAQQHAEQAQAAADALTNPPA